MEAKMLEFETRNVDCPVCGENVDLPVDMFGVMTRMPELVSTSFTMQDGPGADGWTPREVAAHLADVEVTLGWRIRQVLSENEPMLQPFDQDTWATSLQYKERDLATSLETFAANRKSNLELLRRAGDAGLDRKYSHPQFGNRPLRAFIEHIADHDVLHLRQIRGISA
jgi:hypothetical protein